MKGTQQVCRSYRSLAVSIALAQWVCGCAIVNIHTNKADEAQVATRFGIVSVEIKPQYGAVLIESASLGAIKGVEGLAIGYHRSSILTLSDSRCQLVIWINTQEQINELEKLLHDRADVCIVRPNVKSGEKL